MNEAGEVKSYAEFVLPTTVVSKMDISRLVSEAERVDNELTTARIRAKAGSSEQEKPPFSEQFGKFLEQNNLNFDDDHHRSDIITQLRLLKDNVPVIHMTFAVTADRESLQELVQWLRTSINPQTVISTGLQPAIVAGVYVRTPNHVHDLSLRAKLKESRDVLVKELEVIRG